jgi:hypothetical protein
LSGGFERAPEAAADFGDADMLVPHGIAMLCKTARNSDVFRLWRIYHAF